MYLYLTTALIALHLIGRGASHPSERAEMPQKSPVDVIVETKEGFGFNLIQRRLIDALHPKPILDTITEEEKYGNRMEHNIGKKVVKAVEGVSNLVNSAFRVPEEIAKRGSTKLTEVLDNIGGKIVGLQK
ncbi:uncharacterized protein LOC128991175 [Macrosteles quadrilineatus]|uniref:uncharacterized protein LOC128991175 n=1 Tax=Macrosteles quadrilineatus TaxID=74068 RepID=UPI0023E0F6DC|nr:uncharacterized protein LOC128991175 [Macrosteles quadrilineatus]